MGAPYKLKNICKIYQLTLDEICLGDNCLGFDKYNYIVNLITMDNEDILDLLKKKGVDAAALGLTDLSVFQYLMMCAANDKNFLLDLKTGISTFIKEKVLISTKSNMIIVGDPTERRIIGEEEFAEFANALRAFNKMRIKTPPPENETPMQKRFRLKREQREKVKEKQKSKDDEDAPGFADIISSLCVMQIGINVLNIGKLTVYQIKEQLERAQCREKYYTELDMLMAGADSKKIKPIHYVRNLLKEVN